MKRYQFELNGEIVYKNVSPENEDMFFNKYGRYNPTLVTEEPGKSQGTSQSQNNQQENTESKSEDGSSDLQDSKLFKAVKATMLTNPIGRMMATTVIGGKAFGEIREWRKEDKAEKDEVDYTKAEATFLADSSIEDKRNNTGEILEYKIGDNGKRLYYNPNIVPFGSFKKPTSGWDEEVDYEYDRSQGVRFKSRSAGKFVDDIAYMVGNALAGSQSGEYTSEMADLMADGDIQNMTLEEASRIRKVLEKQANAPRSAKTERWIEIMEKEKNPIYGFLRATIDDPATAMDITITSITGQVNAHFGSPEIAAAAHAAGAATSAATYKAYKGPGRRAMAIAAYARGVMSTLGGAVETTSKFGELIKGEFGGNVPTEQELVELFQDVDKFRKFRNKAILKGLTIAAVDNIGGGIVQNSVFRTAKTGRKALAVGKGVAGETITGGGGEALSQVVIGEKINAADVGLEILGQGGQAVVDVGPALFPGEYIVNKGKPNEERVSFDKIEQILQSATPEEIADMNIEIKNNNALDARVKQQEYKGILLSSIDSRVVDQETREEILEKQQELLKKQNELKKKQEKAKSVGLDEAKVDPALQEEIQVLENDIAQITEGYTALEGTETVEEAKARSERIADKKFKGNLEFAKKHSALYGLKYKEMTQDEVRKKYGDDTADNSSGFVDSDTNELVINLDIAKNVNDVEVGNHELLHGILRKALKDGDINTTLIEDLKNQIGEQWSAVEQRVKDGGYTNEYMNENPDEWITLTSDAIRAGEITYSESAFQPLIDVITPILRAFGFKKINFKDGKAVFDFLKEYNRSIHKGTLSSGIVSETAGTTQTEGGIKQKRVSSKGPVDNLAINPDTNNRYTKEEWNDSGANRAIAEIKKQNLLDNLIASKYKIRPVPDRFVDDVLGSSFFINHIKSFNPEINDSLFGWVNSQIRNKAGSVFNQNEKGRLPKGTKTIEADARTTEGQERVQLEDVDTSFERIDNEEINFRDKQIHQAKPEVRERKSTFRRELGIKGIGKGVVFRAVKTALATAESITNPKKFLKSYEKTLADTLFDFMKSYLPDTTSMIKYRVAILESMPISTLVQMQKQLAEKIFVKSYGRLTNKTQISDFVYGRNESGKNPGKKKLLTDDILNDTESSKRRRAAGVPVYERLKPTSTQWKNYLEATEKGKRQTAGRSGTKGNNRIKILEESAKGIGKDATPENLTKEFIQDYITRKGLEGQMTVEEVTEEINKTIKRPSDLKFKRINKAQANEIGVGFNKAASKMMSSYDTQSVLKKRKNEKGKWETDFDAIIKAGRTLREQTVDVLGRLKSSMTHRLKEIRKVTTKSRRSFMTNVGNFDSMVEYNDAIQDIMERFGYSEKGTRKLDSKRVRYNNKTKTIEFNTGTLTRKQNWVPAKKFTKDQYSKVDSLIDFLKEIKRHLDLHPNDRWFFVEIFKDTQNNMDAITRISAPLLGLPVNNNGNIIFNEEIIEEHMFVQSDIGKLFFYAHDNNLMPQLEQVLKSSYAQIALRQSDNSKIDQAKLGKSMGDIFYNEIIPRLLRGKIEVKDGMLSIARYAMAGIDLNTYILSDTEQTITDHFGIGIKNYNQLNEAQQTRIIEVQNKGLVEYFRGNTNLDKVKAEVEAIAKIKYKRTASQVTTDNNIQKANLKNKRINKAVGMSTFDFDETLIIDGENFVIATHPKTKEVVKIKSGEWPIKGPELAEQGFNFNFDDFVNVRGGIDGPLLQKMKNQVEKYGPNNVFVLTARPQNSDVAIHEWLKSKGINIPFKNITGLADGRGQAKANWMLEKFAEGYNDMYFVDDALPNVEAVKSVLDQLDIKSKVVQAKLKFKRTASENFNTILEESQGTMREKVISQAEAKKMGKNKGWWRLFVPPSAEDFKGLLYRFLGRGRQGDMHMKYFKIKLLDPFSRGIRDWNRYKQSMAEDFKNLQKSMKEVVKKINNKVPGTVLTIDSAIRVYLWDRAGFEIPGITPELKNKLLEYVYNNPDVKAFADALGVISRMKEGYIKPNENWSIQTVASDLNNVVNKVGRKQFLSEFLENSKAIFTPDNMNKIEALYGTGFRDALENSLYRMEHGTNRLIGRDRVVNMFYDWVNGAIGAIMFVNMRSALLQTLSTVNFVNMSDNNMFKAAKAFADQPQYWKDFAMLFNSPQLKQRRAGLRTDVSASELTKTFAEGGVTMLDKVNSILKYILEKGFTPTQMADSFAIAFGGATFYRNRLKTYLKQGMSETKAKEQAMLDFQEIAEETQQSSREDLVSQQQASVLGRLILAFQNVTMQYTRLTKKKLSDLANRRRIPGYTQMQSDMANISGILYYGMVQNLIFGALQSGLMFILFGLRDDDEQEEKKTKRVINGALDSLLRGTGVYGAVVSTIKNVVNRWKEEKKKGWNKDFGNVIVEALQLSPPIGSKLRKIYSAMKTEDWNPGVSEKIGWRIENPNIVAIALTIEGLTNIPIARLINKANNVEEAVTGNHNMWQRIALALGWNRWDIGVKDEELEKAKSEAKTQRKQDKKNKKDKEKKEKGLKTVRCSGTRSNGERCKLTTETKAKSWTCMHHSTFKDGMDLSLIHI